MREAHVRICLASRLSPGRRSPGRKRPGWSSLVTGSDGHGAHSPLLDQPAIDGRVLGGPALSPPPLRRTLASSSSDGTVIKGKAPVAKELLKVRFPKPKEFTLSNGVTVYVLEDHRLPAVRMSLTVRAGTLFEPKPGVAEMTAAMLTEGTTSADYKRLAEETEGIGASVNARREHGERHRQRLPAFRNPTDTLIHLLADVLAAPDLPAGPAGPRQVPADLAGWPSAERIPPRSPPISRAKVFYGGTPFGRTSPKAAEINAITRDDLVAFHDAYYKPNGARPRRDRRRESGEREIEAGIRAR